MEDNLTSTPSQETPESQAVLPSAEISETPAAPEEELAAPSPTRSKKWFIIGVILIIFLAAAAFLGARLLKPQGVTGGPGGGQMMFSSKGGPGGAKSVRINMTPAKEIPQEKASTAGLFVRREDQSIFIGTGRIQMMVRKGSGGSAESSGNYDGPVVEVVITHETKVYQDITDMNPGNLDAKNGGEMKVQQVVKPGSLEDLGKNSMVSVWGDKQGDRYVAKAIVFR